MSDSIDARLGVARGSSIPWARMYYEDVVDLINQRDAAQLQLGEIKKLLASYNSFQIGGIDFAHKAAELFSHKQEAGGGYIMHQLHCPTLTIAAASCTCHPIRIVEKPFTPKSTPYDTSASRGEPETPA